MDWKLVLQIVGVCLGLLYLWLEYRADIRLWIVGLIMPIVHGSLYYRQGLYADASMQVYYILAGIYGWVIWYNSQHSKEHPESRHKIVEIAHTPLRLVPALVAVYAACHVGIYFLLTNFTNSNVPFWDSLSTALTIVATWMLSRKYVEQWLVWFAVDAITVGLYLYKEIPLTASLYLVYMLLALIGYRRWLKEI